MQRYKHSQSAAHRFMRGGAGITVAAVLLPTVLAGCGSPQTAPPAPAPASPAARTNTGLSTGQKVTLLAGAAALYYMYNRYKKNNAAQLANQNVQYYLSQNGRVYYRDPKTKEAVWVTPPPAQAPTFQVPAEEARQYQDFSGYSGNQGGRDLRDVFPTR